MVRKQRLQRDLTLNREEGGKMLGEDTAWSRAAQSLARGGKGVRSQWSPSVLIIRKDPRGRRDDQPLEVLERSICIKSNLENRRQ